jgi:hypothetical protein
MLDEKKCHLEEGKGWDHNIIMIIPASKLAIYSKVEDLYGAE